MLRAGAVVVFESGMVYFCSAKCRAEYAGRPRPIPGRHSRPPSRPPEEPADEPKAEPRASKAPARQEEPAPARATEPRAKASTRPVAATPPPGISSKRGLDQRTIEPKQPEESPEPDLEATPDRSRRPSPPANDEPAKSEAVPISPSRTVPLGHPLKVGLGTVLFVVSLLAMVLPQTAAARASGFQVQLIAALLALGALGFVAVHALFKKGWRAAIEEALVCVGAGFALVAGVIDPGAWALEGPTNLSAYGALVATPGVALFTWLGRWLEAMAQQGLLRRLPPLRTRSIGDLQVLGPQLWGDDRSENTASRSWAEQAGADPVGTHPLPETTDLLRQITATRGDGASPIGRDATRWAAILIAAAFPVALLLLFALIHWDRNTTASLLLAAATVLALNPRALRRGWVGPMLAAAGNAAGRGVLFRDGAALEATARSHWIVFDAQGTLTWGRPKVTSVVRVGTLEEDELLALVAGVEKAAGGDALGNAIVDEALQRDLTPALVRLARRTPGMGVSATSPRGDLLVGTRQFLLGQGISVAEADEEAAEMESNAATVVFVALAGRIQGVIGLHDARRPRAKSVAPDLSELGVEPVLMTGDSRLTADALGKELGFEHVRAEVTPDQWAAQVSSLRETGHGIAMVARPPRHEETLAAADVGLTLGGPGLELDAAGVALDGDDPNLAVTAVGTARSALRATKINLFIAAALVIVELGLASLALSSMSQGHHAWTLPIAVPVIVALVSSLTAAFLSWELRSGARSVRF